MHLNFKHTKINNKKAEKGLSLIESAMVLALAATVTAGVMFYYQSAADSNKTQSAISEVMSATSAINGLYIGQSSYSGLTSTILINSSAIPDNYKNKTAGTISNPFGGDLNVSSVSTGGYKLELTKLPRSACISLATLNLGTSASGYGVGDLNSSNGSVAFNDSISGSNQAKKTAISPSEAAMACQDGTDNKVSYFMK